MSEWRTLSNQTQHRSWRGRKVCSQLAFVLFRPSMGTFQVTGAMRWCWVRLPDGERLLLDQCCGDDILALSLQNCLGRAARTGHVGGCPATSWSCFQRFNDVQPCSGENLDSSRPMLSMNKLPGGNSFNHICLVTHYSSTGTCLQIAAVKCGEIIHCPRVNKEKDVLNESFGSIRFFVSYPMKFHFCHEVNEFAKRNCQGHILTAPRPTHARQLIVVVSSALLLCDSVLLDIAAGIA